MILIDFNSLSSYTQLHQKKPEKIYTSSKLTLVCLPRIHSFLKTPIFTKPMLYVAKKFKKKRALFFFNDDHQLHLDYYQLSLSLLSRLMFSLLTIECAILKKRKKITFINNLTMIVQLI